MRAKHGHNMDSVEQLFFRACVFAWLAFLRKSTVSFRIELTRGKRRARIHCSSATSLQGNEKSTDPSLNKIFPSLELWIQGFKLSKKYFEGWFYTGFRHWMEQTTTGIEDSVREVLRHKIKGLPSVPELARLAEPESVAHILHPFCFPLCGRTKKNPLPLAACPVAMYQKRSYSQGLRLSNLQNG